MTTPAPVRTLPPDALEGGLAFHRLVFARRRSGWWTPLVVGVLGIALYAAMLGILLLAGIVAALVSPAFGEWMLGLDPQVMFDFTDPLMVALMLGTIALMLPAYLLASLIVNGSRLGLVSSAAGQLRWRWLLLCIGAAAALTVVLTLLSLLLPAEDGVEAGAVVAPDDNPMLWVSLAVLLVVVPLQSAAEEYVFRGYLQQAIGRWLRHPLFAILLPVPLFVLGHLYDPLGQASVALFAIVAGWLTWRTGGLEAAIALHVVNNLLAFLLGLAGLSDVNASSPGIASFVFSLVLTLGYAGIVEWMYRRSGMGRTLILRPQPAVAAPPTTAVPDFHRAG